MRIQVLDRLAEEPTDPTDRMASQGYRRSMEGLARGSVDLEPPERQALLPGRSRQQNSKLSESLFAAGETLG